jgi:hypothetical protein
MNNREKLHQASLLLKMSQNKYQAKKYLEEVIDTNDIESLDKAGVIVREWLMSDGLKKNEEFSRLLVRIYFKSMCFYLDRASITGVREDLEIVRHHYFLLINQISSCWLIEGASQNLSTMPEKNKAYSIYQQIKTITDQPIYSFKKHSQDAFLAAKEASRVGFKYLGIVIGNAIDFLLGAVPKLLGKDELGMGKKREIKIEKFKTFSEYFSNFIFKDTGFAGAFKYIGKRFGEHVFGNLIGGPISVIVGAMTYPFEYLYRRYREKSNEIKNTAELINSKLLTSAEGEVLNNPQPSTYQYLMSNGVAISSEVLSNINTNTNNSIKKEKKTEAAIPLEPVYIQTNVNRI